MDKREKKELSRQDKLRNRILNIIAAALVVFAAVIIARQFVYVPGEYTAPPTPVPTPAATPLPPEATPAPTPEPTPYVKRIPVKLYFTERELSCPVEPVGIVPYTDGDGEPMYNEAGEPLMTMGTVDSKDIAGWLENCVSPGEYGNSIFNGHITWKGEAGIFRTLSDMEQGEEIVVEYDDGGTRSFRVDFVDIFKLEDDPDYVMDFNPGDARITLITCHGELSSWNEALGTRNQRCVVVAKPVN